MAIVAQMSSVAHEPLVLFTEKMEFTMILLIKRMRIYPNLTSLKQLEDTQMFQKCGL